MTHLKTGKAADLDNITTEGIQHFCLTAQDWILKNFNFCTTTYTIPRLLMRARVVALLKPGKEPTNPKSYRTISLLCIRISVEKELTLNQVGFLPGRS